MPLARIAALLAALSLAGCNSGPYFGTSIGIGPGGASIYPHVSGNVGGIGVGIGGAIR